MATYNNGILGKFSGKVGPVVGASWRDKHVLRSRPSKPAAPPSEEQLNVRSKLSLVSSFLAPLGGFLKRTFIHQFGCATRRGASVSYYTKYVVKSTENGYVINYAKMLVSAGTLRQMQNPSVHVEPDHSLLVQWEDNSGMAMAEETHLLTMVLYAPEIHEFYFVENTAQRSEQQTTIAVPTQFQVAALHVWGFFSELKEDGVILQVSISDYLGEVDW